MMQGDLRKKNAEVDDPDPSVCAAHPALTMLDEIMRQIVWLRSARTWRMKPRNGTDLRYNDEHIEAANCKSRDRVHWP